MGSRDRSPPKTSLAIGTRPREPDKSSAQPDLCYSLELNHAMLVSSGQRITAPSCAWLLQRISTFTFMHLADAFIQTTYGAFRLYIFLSVCVFPGNRTHNLCAANAMLYHWATGTLFSFLLNLSPTEFCVLAAVAYGLFIWGRLADCTDTIGRELNWMSTLLHQWTDFNWTNDLLLSSCIIDQHISCLTL